MDFSVQTDLPCHHNSADNLRADHLKSSQHCCCHRYIKTGSLFLHVCRSKIDGNSLWWKLITIILECCAYPFLRFLYLRRRKSYHDKGRKSVTYISFYLHRAYFHPKNCS